MEFLKQRILGALFLLSLAIILVPAFFDGPIVSKTFAADREIKNSAYQLALAKQLTDSNQYETEANLSNIRAFTVNSTSNAWSVRVGSFSDIQVAAELENKLRDYGYTAYVKALSDNDGMYGVFVGPELIPANAHSVQEQLNEHLNLNGVIVPYDPVLYVNNPVHKG